MKVTELAVIEPSLMNLAFVLALSVACLSLPQLSRAAVRCGLVDRPSRRKRHGTSKPFVGGVGMALGFFLSVAVCIGLSRVAGLLAGMITILIIGFLDDWKELNHWWKLAGEMAAALMIVYWSGIYLFTFGDLLSLGSIDFHDYSIPVTVFCIVGIANAFNMMDGMDGLAGGVSLTAFLSFACISALSGHPALMLLSVAMSGAIIGFLRYNWHPARLFMGDTGSLFLGFTAAFVSIAVTQGAQGVVRPVIPLLVLAVPVTDALTVILKRIAARRNPFHADRNHIHHTLLRMGLGTQGSVAVILTLSCIFCILAIAGVIFRIPEHILFLAFSAYFVAHLGLSFLAERLPGRGRPCHGANDTQRSATIGAEPAGGYAPRIGRTAVNDGPVPLSQPVLTFAAADEERLDRNIYMNGF